MYGVLFDEKHSYKDWGLILKSRPEISPPSPKTIYVDVPSSNGFVDLTDSLTGFTCYNNRTLKFKFNVISKRTQWTKLYSDIMSYLHGKRIKAILDEDPCYYYIGRFQVNEWESSKVTSVITIEGNVEPYKLERFTSLEPDKWASNNLKPTIKRDYRDISINGTRYYTINGTDKPVVPSFTVSGSALKVMLDVKYYDLPVGTTVVPEILTRNGYNTLKFTGNGKVSIEYRGGLL